MELWPCYILTSCFSTVTLLHDHLLALVQRSDVNKGSQDKNWQRNKSRLPQCAVYQKLCLETKRKIKSDNELTLSIYIKMKTERQNLLLNACVMRRVLCTTMSHDISLIFKYVIDQPHGDKRHSDITKQWLDVKLVQLLYLWRSYTTFAQSHWNGVRTTDTRVN